MPTLDTRRFAGCLFVFVQRRRDTEARQRMQCDSGPSFPASPLIQDDSLLRREIPPRQAKKPGSSGAPILRGAAFLARGGSAREQTLPLIDD